MSRGGTNMHFIHVGLLQKPEFSFFSPMNVASSHLVACQIFSWSFRLPWDTEEAPFESTYRKLVERYSGRILTQSSDVINAFAGILNSLKRDAKQTFLWALPECFLSNALTWSCDDHSKRRQERCSIGSSDDKIIHCSFPSWS
ncbi:hypothetical protein M758_4G135500 [Ceratodon purpureus]|nr:hypothetical protein M758_4G135500 [Ceratodon purpureus]